MAKEMKVPDIGGFEGVEVIDVLVAEGDEVKKEDSLITLESDKAAMDVPASFAGTVKELKVKAGDKIGEGDVILLAEPAGEDSGDDDGSGEAEKKERPKGASDEESEESEAEKSNAEDENEEKDKAHKRDDEDKDKDKGKDKDGDKAEDEDEDNGETEDEKEEKASPPEREPEMAAPPTVERAAIVKAHAGPSVRKFARELGVDLSRVKGSGRKDRITHEDIKRHVKAALRGGGGAGLPAVREVDFSRYGEVETKPLSRIKRIAGPHLQAAWVNAPHVTQHDEADMTTLETVRKAMNASAGKDAAKLTPLAFLVRAVVLAMKAYPDFNASLDVAGENLIVRRYFHIGFAVDTEQGLIVPVIRDADKKDLSAIAGELAALGEKARSGKLKRDEIEGGCFSISSLGSIGGTAFTPIVNAPEVAVLGVSRAEMKPKWNGHDFEARFMLPLSLSYDHRVIDGAMAVRFTRHLAETIETLRGFVG